MISTESIAQFLVTNTSDFKRNTYYRTQKRIKD